MKQKIAVFYLDTGGGHIGPAKALVNEIHRLYPNESETFLQHGFSERMKSSRFFFEDGYRLTTNYFEAGYVLFYRITALTLAIHFGNYLISIHGERDLARFLRDKGITKVVCMHEVLILILRKVIDRVNPLIPLITVVTDPFTAHNLWFFRKNNDLIVFSEKLKKDAIERYGFSPERIHVFPFMLSRAFDTIYTEFEKLQAMQRLGVPKNTKVLLIAGGGEGLKNAASLVSLFIKEKRTETLIVVCGKNVSLRRRLNKLVKQNSSTNILVYGFVDFMPDLLNIADCVITKGGASTVMEVLACGKPVIFSTYIRGQELGNVLYAIHNGVGWYIKKPADIINHAVRVLEDSDMRTNIQTKCANLHLRNGAEDIARFIYQFDAKN